MAQKSGTTGGIILSTYFIEVWVAQSLLNKTYFSSAPRPRTTKTDLKKIVPYNLFIHQTNIGAILWHYLTQHLVTVWLKTAPSLMGPESIMSRPHAEMYIYSVYIANV